MRDDCSLTASPAAITSGNVSDAEPATRGSSRALVPRSRVDVIEDAAIEEVSGPSGVVLSTAKFTVGEEIPDGAPDGADNADGVLVDLDVDLEGALGGLSAHADPPRWGAKT